MKKRTTKRGNSSSTVQLPKTRASAPRATCTAISRVDTLSTNSTEPLATRGAIRKTRNHDPHREAFRQIHQDTIDQSERLLDEYLSVHHPDYQALENRFIFLRVLPRDLRIVRGQRHAELVKRTLATQDPALTERLRTDEFMNGFTERRNLLLAALDASAKELSATSSFLRYSRR